MSWQQMAWQSYEFFAHQLSLLLSKLPLGKQTRKELHRMIGRLSWMLIPNPVFVQGSYIYWHRAVYEQACGCFCSGGYELDTTLLVQSLLRPTNVAVDVGASIGYYSLLFAKLVGEKGKVYAFEPQPLNCDALDHSIQTNGYSNIIKVVQKAVSNKTGFSSLYLSDEGDQLASLYQTPKYDKESRRVVETITLDEFFESERWPTVDLIKMDIQGAEKAALEGAKRLITRNSQLKLILEFHPLWQAAAGITPNEFFDKLVELGFRKFWAIKSSLQLINIPQDIPSLDQTLNRGPINILCTQLK
jgi:FkbM family methyltransferase